MGTVQSHADPSTKEARVGVPFPFPLGSRR